jgi:hypothetical protein
MCVRMCLRVSMSLRVFTRGCACVHV